MMAASNTAIQFSPSSSLSSTSHLDLDSSDRGTNTSQHQHQPFVAAQIVEQSTCRESYRLFKKCPMARETEGFSCSDVVKKYMQCALNGC
mmetsp:Transcript_6042/g.9554  ORF Transcript_6042/g.9554 Transcript_6042/m.9554 type:complete len:90 (-) Transcript_6042:344-613(-)